MFWHKKEGNTKMKQGFFSNLFHKEESFSFEQGKAPIMNSGKEEPSIHPDVVEAAFKKIGVDVNKRFSPTQRVNKLHNDKEQLVRESSNFEKIKKKIDFELRERRRHLQGAELITNNKLKMVLKKEKDLDKKEQFLKGEREQLLKRESDIKSRVHELEDLDITLNTRSKHVEKKTKELKIEEKRLAKEKEDYLREVDLLETKREETKHLGTEMKEEKGRYENRLKFMNKAFQHKLEKKEVDLKDRWKDIHRKEAEISLAKKEFTKQSQYFEEKGFELFLQEEKKGKHNLSVDKLEDLHEKLKIPELEQANLYKKITNCRELVKKNEVNEAKELYNKIRKQFYNLESNNADREVIKNSIRDLYDTINLSALGR